MIGFDAGHLKAKGNSNDKYVVIQVVLTEKFIGTGSGISSLTNLQATINEQLSKLTSEQKNMLSSISKNGDVL